MSRIRPTTNPTDLSTLLRKPARPLRYWWPTRWTDTINGRRDGRIHQAGARSPRDYLLAPDATAWLRHNGHALSERQEREILTYHSLTLELQVRRNTLTSDLEHADADLNDAIADQQGLPELGDEELRQRRATEADTPVETVMLRRRREHHSQFVAPAQARVEAAREKVKALRDELHQVASTLAALQDILDARTVHLSEYHQRRATAYERAYLRRATRTQQDSLPVHAV